MLSRKQWGRFWDWNHSVIVHYWDAGKSCCKGWAWPKGVWQTLVSAPFRTWPSEFSLFYFLSLLPKTACSGACSVSSHLTALCTDCSRYKGDVKCLLRLCFRQKRPIPGMGLLSVTVGLGNEDWLYLKLEPSLCWDASPGWLPLVMVTKHCMDWLTGSSCEQIPCLYSKTRRAATHYLYSWALLKRQVFWWL